jgi:uncharacterized protein DUF6817
MKLLCFKPADAKHKETAMAHSLPQLKEFLIELGAAEVAHTGSIFTSHLTGVYDYLKNWNCPEHVTVAGLFHSIYGSEAFTKFSLDLSRRDEVRNMIGAAAERLVYIFSAVSWPSFQASVMTNNIRHLRNRFTNTPLVVTRQEFDDLLWVHLANVLEQEERLDGKLKRGFGDRKRLWSIVAERLGKQAVESWARVYEEESVLC